MTELGSNWIGNTPISDPGGHNKMARIRNLGVVSMIRSVVTPVCGGYAASWNLVIPACPNLNLRLVAMTP